MFFPTVVDEKALIGSIGAKFNAPVDSNDFKGVLNFTDISKSKKGYWFDQTFSIENGKHTLDVKLFIETQGLNLEAVCAKSDGSTN